MPRAQSSKARSGSEDKSEQVAQRGNLKGPGSLFWAYALAFNHATPPPHPTRWPTAAHRATRTQSKPKGARLAFLWHSR
jgi:hypothetical protein